MKRQVSRRTFLKAAAASAILPLGGGKLHASKPAESAAPTASMKLGSVSWNFRGIGAGPPMDEPIEIIGEMGFDGIELIVSRPEELDTYWKEPVISQLRKKLDKHGLEVSQFVLFQNAVAGLSSLKDNERNASLKVFERGCKVAAELKAPFINIVAPWATELKGPSSYLPRYYAVTEGAPNVKYHIDIAGGFDFDAVWEQFVKTVKAATAMAKAHGIRFSLENHTHTLVPDARTFRMLWDRVQDPALGMNLDIGWIQLQREYPPVAVYQAGQKLVNVHIRDIDGLGLRFVGIGEGVMDFPGVVKALKNIGFSGYLTFEQDGVPDMRAVLSRGLDILRKLIA